MARFQISRILDFGPIRLGLRAVLNVPIFLSKYPNFWIHKYGIDLVVVNVCHVVDFQKSRNDTT